MRVRGALPGAAVAHEPLPGRAQARNRALAECSAEVIAYLDSDVVVGDDWWHALTAVWAGADRLLACAGGPLRPRFAGDEPAWLRPGLLGALGGLDYGDEALELDPATDTLLGGNVGFRAAALRGIGGFWPARGDDDQVDWFSEEHHAQRELARAGWRSRYEPDLAASRLADGATPRVLLRRRFRYGARMALVGQRRPATTALRRSGEGRHRRAGSLWRGAGETSRWSAPGGHSRTPAWSSGAERPPPRSSPLPRPPRSATRCRSRRGAAAGSTTARRSSSTTA